MNILPNTGNFLISISTKSDGNMAYEYGERSSVDKNRSNFFAQLGITQSQILEINIAHSCNVGIASRQSSGDFNIVEKYMRSPTVHSEIKGFYTGFDGIVTFDDIFITLLTADCIPLFLWDNNTGLHGIVHVGLLGAINGIVLNLQKLYDDHGISPSEVNYYVGPAITQVNYDISKSGLWNKIKNQVFESFPIIKNYIQFTEIGDYIDIQGMLIDQIEQIGANDTKVHSHSGCTAAEDSPFFSHYVATQSNTANARFISVIGPKLDF